MAGIISITIPLQRIALQITDVIHRRTQTTRQSRDITVGSRESGIVTGSHSGKTVAQRGGQIIQLAAIDGIGRTIAHCTVCYIGNLLGSAGAMAGIISIIIPLQCIASQVTDAGINLC